MAVATSPNSVMRSPKESDRIYRKGVWWVQCYCANCGVKGPLVIEQHLRPKQLGQPTFATWVCDERQNDCFSKHGLEFLGGDGKYVAIPDELFWAEAHAVMLEDYGRILTPYEIEEITVADNSSLAKLARDRFTPGKFGR